MQKSTLEMPPTNARLSKQPDVELSTEVWLFLTGLWQQLKVSLFLLTWVKGHLARCPVQHSLGMAGEGLAAPQA